MKNTTLTLLAASVGILFFACANDESISDSSISLSIEHLESSNKEGAFVMIEALPYDYFISFMKASDQSVLIDFPVSTYLSINNPHDGPVLTSKAKSKPNSADYTLERVISEDEVRRLEDYLRSWEVAFRHYLVQGEFPKGKVVRYYDTIKGRFDLASDKQAEFVHGLFTEVYQLNDYTINIVEN